MRQAFANQLAAVTGVLIIVLAVIFALIQTPSIAENALIAAAPLIPHPLEGYEDCTSCHGRNERVPYPDNHLGWPNTSCTQCHIPEAAVAVATAVAVPIEAAIDGAEQESEAERGQEEAASAESQATQIANGESIYRIECAQCHEPGGTGPELNTAALAAYGTAGELFTYIQRTMPPDTPGSLSEQQYWDVTAYLLATHALLPAETLVGPETGDEIELSQP
jgi:mono/diheme cytochrome c family protein